jgi:hypothetical protein
VGVKKEEGEGGSELRRRERERERDQLGEAHIRAAGRERRSVEVKQVTGMTKGRGMWGCAER